jgi:CO/xanthine dehydrogenase Mo-binding subunit
MAELSIKVNGRMWPVAAAPDTPLLYVLTNELELRGPRFGCGLAQRGSCSVLADGVEIRFEVNQRTGVIVAKRLYGALDCGLAVNPALVEIVGQMVQSTSRVLKEEVIFDRSHVTSLDWMSYPILRFAEHPEVVPVVVQRPEYPSTGAGEEVMGATAAAIANALFDATGARLRQYPMTPERVRAALAARI